MRSERPARMLAILDPVTGEITPRGMTALIVGAFAVTLLSILIVDRAVAQFAHTALRVAGKEHWLLKALTDIPDPIPVAAGLVTAIYAVLLLLGGRPGPRGRVALEIALAILVAITIKEHLKVLTGRTWPETWTPVSNPSNPSFIRDGVFTFEPLKSLLEPRTGRGYLAFPSGHMTIIAVAMVSLVLNVRSQALRWLALLPIVLVAIGMIGCNYHWVSDVVFGTALGAAVALSAHRLGRICR